MQFYLLAWLCSLATTMVDSILSRKIFAGKILCSCEWLSIEIPNCTCHELCRVPTMMCYRPISIEPCAHIRHLFWTVFEYYQLNSANIFGQTSINTHLVLRRRSHRVFVATFFAYFLVFSGHFSSSDDRWHSHLLHRHHPVHLMCLH